AVGFAYEPCVLRQTLQLTLRYALLMTNPPAEIIRQHHRDSRRTTPPRMRQNKDATEARSENQFQCQQPFSNHTDTTSPLALLPRWIARFMFSTLPNKYMAPRAKGKDK